MSFFFEGANRPRPAKDFSASPTGYQERHYGGPDGARTVIGHVNWPFNIAHRYFGRVNVAMSDHLMKQYIENVSIQDAYSARNGVQSRLVQYEPGQSVVMQYRSNGSTAPIITGGVTATGNWTEFVENGTIYGIDDLIPGTDFAPMASTALPTVVNNEWWGTWTVGALRGMREEDPINGNDAQVGMIPGPLSGFIDAFGNTADLFFSHEQTLEFGDDTRSQGHFDGIAPRAVDNAELAVRHAQNELKHAEPARADYSRGPFSKIETDPLPASAKKKSTHVGIARSLRLLETTNEQLQDAIDVAQTHEQWITKYPLEYVERLIEHWGYLDGLGINKVAEHIPPPLTLEARSRFGGYDIPPPMHEGSGIMTINYAEGPGPDLSINRYELYKTASPLPPVSVGDTVSEGGHSGSSGGGRSAGSSVAQSPGRKPFLHITPRDNDLNITHRPEDSLSVYLAAMGLPMSRYIVHFAKSFFDTQSLFDLLSALMAALQGRDRLILALAQRQLGQPIEEIRQQLEVFNQRALPKTWVTALESDDYHAYLKQHCGCDFSDPWVCLEGRDALLRWLTDNGINPLANLLASGKALDFFGALCSLSTGVAFNTLPRELGRLRGAVKRALRIPVLGDALI